MLNCDTGIALIMNRPTCNHVDAAFSNLLKSNQRSLYALKWFTE